MKKNKEGEMDFSKALAKRMDNLPATIEDLHAYVLVGEQQIKAYQAKIQACKKIPDAQKFKAAALQEAQGFAETVIIAQANLGELLAAMTGGRPSGSPRGSQGGTSKPLPSGITKKESHKAQTIAKNPEVVQKVIALAKEEKRIPTPNEVVKAVNKKPTAKILFRPSSGKQIDAVMLLKKIEPYLTRLTEMGTYPIGSHYFVPSLIEQQAFLIKKTIEEMAGW